MDSLYDHPHLVDTLRFPLYAARSLPQEEIRLGVLVTAFVPVTDKDRGELNGRISAALKRLANAPWSYSRIEREEEAPGFERVCLRAYARLPASENRKLVDRARAAGGDGVALSDPQVSYALSADRVDEAVAALRLDLLQQATRQAEAFTAANGRAWRVGDIVYGTGGYRDSGRRTAKGAYADDSDAGDLPASAEAAGVVRTGERISLVATVVLKAAAPDAGVAVA